jgi:tetratricopeptide (TPR) repeat protein
MGAPAFEAEMKVVQGLLERGQCGEGRKRLRKLLDDHPQAAYARGRRVQIEELMRQLVFGATVPQPETKKVVSGELLQWNPRDGTIKIRYTPETIVKDCSVGSNGLFAHPASFRGPHTITIKGSNYPGSGARFFVCDNSKGAIALVAGVKDKSYAFVAYVYRGDEEPIKYHDCLSPVAAGRPYELKVIVTEKEVKCCWLNKWFLRVSKEPDHWGSLALDLGKSFDEVLITGRIEPSWIQGLMDKARQEGLKEFEGKWQPKDDLPAWLFEAAPASTQDDPTPRDWPAEMDEDAADVVRRAVGLQEVGEASAALKLIDTAGSGTVPDLVLAYLRGVLLHDLGRHEEAAASCRQVREKDPAFVPSVIVEVQALVALGRGEEALAIYRDLLSRFPRAADLHADAALFLGASGRWAEADRLVAAALASGARSERLDLTSRLVHKAVRGPPWPKCHDYESAHYVVLSDMDPKVCFEASQILEQAYAVFSNRLERAPSTAERFKVFLFSGQAGYQEHAKEILGSTVPHSAGFYAPALRQLFIWNLPEREDMMRTVRHEGFHQYLHRIMDDPPLWFNEGLAEYFEEAKVVSGKWTTGEPRRDHLAMLAMRAPQPLRDFLFLDDRGFMANASANYAQAWAFMQYLLHTSRENRQLFDRFWDSFKKIPAHAEAIRAALGDRSIDLLDGDFRAHVEGLRKR